MTDVILKDAVLDGGLEVLNTLATAIWVCAGTPTDYTDAQTKELGFKTFGAGNAFGNPANGTPDGRQITSVAITDGTVNNSGTVTCWAVVDVVNTTLLAVGDLTGGMAVTAGWAWTLDAFTIRMPAAASAGIDADTEAWVNAVVTAGGTVSDTQAEYVDELITGLKADGLFTLCEGLWLFAGEGVEEQAQIDVVNLNAGTTVGGLVYGDGGITDGGSANSAFETGLSSYSTFTLNSASICTVMLGDYGTPPGDGSLQVGCVSTSHGNLRLYWSIPVMQSVVNSSTTHNSTTTNPLNSPSQGVLATSRTTGTDMAAYRDGTQLDTWSDTATAVPGTSFAFLARHDGGSSYSNFCDTTVTLAAGWLGAGLDATQAAALNTNLCNYLAHYHIFPTIVNHVRKSQEFDNAAWTKSGVTVTANDTTAPDGTATADLVYPNTSGNFTSSLTQTGHGDGSHTSYTMSFYAKPKSWTWIMVRLYDFTGNSQTWFNVPGGTVGTTGSSVSAANITSVGDGWYRISIATTAAGGNAQAHIFFCDADNTGVCTNSGTNGMWIWGMQVVYGSSALTYSRAF